MSQQKGTILVVDDEPDSLRLLTDSLTEEGYRVRPANTGQLALASMFVERPDLILLDVRMPVMDGFEVCRRIKASEENQNIPVIFTSASTNEEEHVDGLSLGAVDFVTKPLRREELLARVRTHLELSRLRDHLETEVADRTAELRESEARFRELADAAPILIWAAGTDKLCTFFNKGWLAFTGRSEEQEIGDGWAQGVHPDDLQHCYTAYCSAFDARRSFQIEYRLRRADGEYRWILDSGAPRFSACVFLGYIGSCVDITDLKWAQDESFSRQKLESMGLMAGGIAHDFNNLLGTILASTELAAGESADGLSCDEELHRIRTTAIRGAELVRELMIYAGHESPVFELVDFTTLINEMLRLLEVTISKRVIIKTNLGQDLPQVRASPSQLRQLVMNLVTNACDAIGGRLGEIRISTERVYLDGNYLRLKVSDTGSGMTREVQAKIFDPFFSTKQANRGLGLAVIQGIVRTHGGKIAVASEPGKGTTFEILLPCAASAMSQRSRSDGMDTLSIVHDFDSSARAVQKASAKAGYASR